MTSDDKIKSQVHDYNIEPAMVGDSLNQKGERWNWYTEVDGEYVKTPTPDDPVTRPAHYTSGEIECIDAMREAFGDEALKAFCKLNAFKYLCMIQARRPKGSQSTWCIFGGLWISHPSIMIV